MSATWLAGLDAGDHVLVDGMRAELRMPYDPDTDAVVRWVRWSTEYWRWVGSHHVRVGWDLLAPLCESPISAPPELTDGTLDYCVAPCGYTVVYPIGMFDTYGRGALAAHDRTAHPGRVAQIEDIRARSAD